MESNHVGDGGPDGSMANLGRRQFANNSKAVRDIRQQLADGDIDTAQARVMLSALGLNTYSVSQLVDDETQSVSESYTQRAAITSWVDYP